MARRVRLSWPQQARPAGEVVTRVREPDRGWTLEQARDLVRQGYSVQRAAEVTGYHPKQLELAPERRRSGQEPNVTSGS